MTIHKEDAPPRPEDAWEGEGEPPDLGIYGDASRYLYLALAILTLILLAVIVSLACERRPRPNEGWEPIGDTHPVDVPHFTVDNRALAGMGLEMRRL